MKTKKFDLQKEYKFAQNEYFFCYFRTFGQNYEVGIMHEGKTFFFGNFINKAEAMLWYKELNKEMRYFLKHYTYFPNMKMSWYMNFARNYFYTAYYRFLDRAFTKYTRNFKKAYTTDIKMYKKYESKYDYAM